MHTSLKIARNIALSITALLVVSVGGGLAYTWYVGQNGVQTSNAFQEPVEPTKQLKVTPRKIDPSATVGISTQYLTSPVKQGDNASLSIKTNPQATCVIVVEYAGVASKDSGLGQKKADEFGIVEWAWTVESSTPLGKWPLKVTCANQKNSAVATAQLEVTK